MKLSLLELEKSLTNQDNLATVKNEIVWSFAESKIQNMKELHQKEKEIRFL